MNRFQFSDMVVLILGVTTLVFNRRFARTIMAWAAIDQRQERLVRLLAFIVSLMVTVSAGRDLVRLAGGGQ